MVNSTVGAALSQLSEQEDGAGICPWDWWFLSRYSPAAVRPPLSAPIHQPSPPLFSFFLNRKSHHQHVGRNTQICKQPFLYRVSHSAPCHPEDLGGSCLQHKMSGTREGCSFFRGLEMPGLLHGSHSPMGTSASPGWQPRSGEQRLREPREELLPLAHPE